MNKIDLRKEIVNQVATSKGINNIKAQVVLVLDYSGSMEQMYRSGFVQRVIERLVPIAMQFDDNGEMELYLFQNSCNKHKNNVTSSSVDGIINREILGKYSFGGTAYAPPINKILEDYVPKAMQEKKGFLSNMFGNKANITDNTKDPVYVIFVTDGDNSDKSNAEAAIKEASKYGVFFQFVGIGNASMAFLDKLDTMEGRFIDNANFFQVNDLDKLEDKELYERLLTEFPSWLNEAKSKKILS